MFAAVEEELDRRARNQKQDELQNELKKRMGGR